MQNFTEESASVTLVRNGSGKLCVRKRCSRKEWNIVDHLVHHWHPNIIQFIDRNEIERYIVMPRLKTFDEADDEKLLRPYCLQIAAQLLAVVKFLHSQCVAHRDIKPENTVFDVWPSVPVLKLIDFDLSHLFDPRDSEMLVKGEVGTPGFMAPEVFQPIPYDAFSADKYSTGAYISRLTDISNDKTVGKCLRTIASMLMHPIASQRPDLGIFLK